MIRAAWGSVAEWTIAPVQDLLSLGRGADELPQLCRGQLGMARACR